MNEDHEKNVKKIIKNKYNCIAYDKKNLTNRVSSIINDFSKETNSSFDSKEVLIFIMKYLHFSSKKKKYYFSLKKENEKTYYKISTLIDVNQIVTEDDETDSEEDKNEENKNNINDNSSIDNSSDGLDEFRKDNDKISKKIDNNKDNKLTECYVSNHLETYTVDSEKEELSVYVYPLDKPYLVKKRTDPDNGPYGVQWVHEKQYDDKLDEVLLKRAEQYDKLRAIVLPEQRTKEWFAMREGAITASDGGTVLGVNGHEPKFRFLLKKTIGIPFTSNKYCYHGKKLEEIATMVYAYRMNVTVEEFGLMMHPNIKFLGASPDGICNRYKLDGKHISKYVGRMLEIKCPYTRQIKKEGEIKGEICPIYYWVQVQLQLECCDLEECDFWQCKLDEYDSRDEFINDTDPNEPFRSISFGMEKGCLIQLLPKNKMNMVLGGQYTKTVHDDSIFIYPTNIEMTPYECDLWVSQQMEIIDKDDKYRDYFFDKVIYWRIELTMNVTIMRDREWFAESLPKMKQMWDYVMFFRKNKEKLDILLDYIDSVCEDRNIKTRAKKKREEIDNDIIDVADKLYNVKAKDYKKVVGDIKKKIEQNNMGQEQSSESDDFMFI